MSVDHKYSLTFLPYYISGFTDDFELKLDIKGVAGSLETQDFGTLQLRGPEHVIDVLNTMIARVYPQEGADDAETNYFPYIEFIDPDFPWRYSLREITNDDFNKITPWLSLIVLETETDEIEDITYNGPDGREILHVKKKFLPNLNNAWGTAHVQLNGFTGNLDADLDDFIDNNPSSHCARLLSFRCLKPETSYEAFLVPTFKKSTIPFFSLKPTSDQMNNCTGKKMWDDKINNEEVVKIPIYYHWSFKTAKKGDFESLIRKIEPCPESSAKIGTSVVDSSENEQEHYFKREGALTSLGFFNESNNKNKNENLRDTFIDSFGNYPKLAELKNNLKISLETTIENKEDKETEDPLVTYPVYGRYYENEDEISKFENNLRSEIWPESFPWIQELNLDLRYRLAASCGTTTIQNNQDEYMEECWEQVGELNKANKKIRQAKAGLGLSDKIFKKHLDPTAGKLSFEQFACISSPFHSDFPILSKSNESITIKQALNKSGISRGVFSPSFKKIMSKKIGSKKLISPIKVFSPWDQALKNEEYFEQVFQGSEIIDDKFQDNIIGGSRDIGISPSIKFHDKLVGGFKDIGISPSMKKSSIEQGLDLKGSDQVKDNFDMKGKFGKKKEKNEHLEKSKKIF